MVIRSFLSHLFLRLNKVSSQMAGFSVFWSSLWPFPGDSPACPHLYFVQQGPELKIIFQVWPGKYWVGSTPNFHQLVFFLKEWGPTVLLKAEVKKILRISCLSSLLVSNSLLLFNSGPSIVGNSPLSFNNGLVFPFCFHLLFKYLKKPFV